MSVLVSIDKNADNTGQFSNNQKEMTPPLSDATFGEAASASLMADKTERGRKEGRRARSRST